MAITREATFELGLTTHVDDLGHAIVRPDVDLQKLVETHGAVIRLRRSGGVEQRWQVIARIAVEIYAATYTRAWQTAEAVSDRLLASPYRAGGWLVDRAVSESANAEQPHPNLRVVAFVVRLTTRDL